MEKSNNLSKNNSCHFLKKFFINFFFTEIILILLFTYLIKLFQQTQSENFESSIINNKSVQLQKMNLIKPILFYSNIFRKKRF